MTQAIVQQLLRPTKCLLMGFARRGSNPLECNILLLVHNKCCILVVYTHSFLVEEHIGDGIVSKDKRARCVVSSRRDTDDGNRWPAAM